MKILDIIPIKDYKKYSSLRNRKNLQLLEKQNWQCNNCSCTAFEIIVKYDEKRFDIYRHVYGINSSGKEILMTEDHIIPKSKGGGRGDNIQILCEDCNHKKANKIIKQNSLTIGN